MTSTTLQRDMSASFEFAPYFRHLEECSASRWSGMVTHANGNLVESEGPFCAVGELCKIVDGRGQTYEGQIVGFSGTKVLSMALDRVSGVRYGDRVITWGARPILRVGDTMLGRVLDGGGRPIDGLPDYPARERRPLDGTAPLPLDRIPIRQPLGCGIRAIDAFITCGRGQRIGIFGGSGVGKSTLLGMMARNTAADLTVMGLVGERGREVREFLEESLGEEGRRRSVVIASTSDQSPLLRIRAEETAIAAAEYFCSRGKHVLLVLDSLTRVAMAQREIGLAAGEPPTAKGYTPSCFNLLARLIERAGQYGNGSITAFYTVLMDGDDQLDPLVDAVRSLLDGHVVLDRKLAARNHYPPIAVLDSLSRLMSAVATEPHRNKARNLRKLMAAYNRSEDLIRVGAYQKGSDPELDRALGALPALTAFLQQTSSDRAPLDETVKKLLTLPE